MRPALAGRLARNVVAPAGRSGDRAGAARSGLRAQPAHAHRHEAAEAHGGEREHPSPAPQGDEAGEGGARYPRQLEDRLVADEGPPACLLRCVGLHQAVERQAACSCAEADDGRHEQRSPEAVAERGGGRRRTHQDEAGDEHAGLGQQPAQVRPEGGAEEAADAAGDGGEREPALPVTPGPEQEREEEHDEAGRRPDGRHGEATGQQPRREQPVVGPLDRRCPLHPWQIQRGQGAHREHGGGEEQDGVGAGRAGDRDPRHPAQDPAEDAHHGQAPVRPHEAPAGWCRVRHERAPAHPVDPRQHEQAEGERVELDASPPARERCGEQHASDHPDGDRRTQRPPEAVQPRRDERREHGEGRHRQGEVQGDGLARLADGDGEEQRVGEGDGDERVACGMRELGEPQALERRVREGAGTPRRRPGRVPHVPMLPDAASGPDGRVHRDGRPGRSQAGAAAAGPWAQGRGAPGPDTSPPGVGAGPPAGTLRLGVPGSLVGDLVLTAPAR